MFDILRKSCEFDHVSKQQGAIIEFIHLPLLVLDYIDHVIRHKLANQFIGLANLHIQNSFIIQAFSLNHLSVMDAHRKQKEVHNLANEKLDELIIELSHKNRNKYDPDGDVERVNAHEVLQHQVPHKKDQR